MRKLIYAINITLDGCVDHTKGVVDDALLDSYTQFLGTFDTIVYGRKTYELMVPYWPNVLKDPSATRAETDYARAFDPIKKVVFSRTRDAADDGNTRFVRDGLRDEIVRLKQEPGKDILTGGVDIPSQLIELGLVDEFRFVVMPVIVGEGRRLLSDVTLPERLRLKLIDSKIFDSGCVALRYAKP